MKVTGGDWFNVDNVDNVDNVEGFMNRDQNLSSFLETFCRSIIVTALSILGVQLTAYGQTEFPGDPIMLEEIAKPDLDAELSRGLQRFDAGIVGDAIDNSNGSLSFSHTDVSLPGNSAIPVSFGRSYTIKGMDYHGNQLGGWNMNIPFISGQSYLGDEELILGLIQNNPDISTNLLGQWGNFGCGSNVTGGVRLFQAGSGGELMLDTSKISDSVLGESGVDYVTQSNWKIKCVGLNSTGPYKRTAFEAVDPNGMIYRFDHTVNYFSHRLDMPSNNPEAEDGEGNHCADPVVGGCAYETPDTGLVFRRIGLVGQAVVYPSEIRDVNGNWVRYEYQSNRLKRIHANDGREITFEYDNESPNSALYIPTLTKVKANGREWNYNHVDDGPEELGL